MLTNAKRGTRVFIGLAPDRFRLRLNATDRAEYGNRAVEHTQGTLNFDGEVHVAGRIDNIHPMIAPEAGRCRRRNRNTALLLLDHPVHRGSTVVHFTDLIVDTGVIQYALRSGGFAGIDVSHDADVARLL